VAFVGNADPPLDYRCAIPDEKRAGKTITRFSGTAYCMLCLILSVTGLW